MAISKGNSLESKIATFSEGAGNKNVLLMIWIFAIAGAFAAADKNTPVNDDLAHDLTRFFPMDFMEVFNKFHKEVEMENI